MWKLRRVDIIIADLRDSKILYAFRTPEHVTLEPVYYLVEDTLPVPNETTCTEHLTMAEIQSRVQDYLDDQIQTAADLDGINALLARVEEQQNILQRQVGQLYTAANIILTIA